MTWSCCFLTPAGSFGASCRVKAGMLLTVAKIQKYFIAKIFFSLQFTLWRCLIFLFVSVFRLFLFLDQIMNNWCAANLIKITNIHLSPSGSWRPGFVLGCLVQICPDPAAVAASPPHHESIFLLCFLSSCTSKVNRALREKAAEADGLWVCGQIFGSLLKGFSFSALVLGLRMPQRY